MKFLTLTATATAALASVAAAASQEHADVFLLRPQTQSSPSSAEHSTVSQIPRQVARKLLLQRAGVKHASMLEDLPDGYDAERLVAELNHFGVRPAPLFMDNAAARGSGSGAGASQLIVLLEGVTSENTESLRTMLSIAEQAPAFIVSDPPSSQAVDYLVDADFKNAGISLSICDLASTIDSFNSKCWSGLSSILRYDLKKNPEAVSELAENLPRLLQFVQTTDLEAALLLLPEGSRNSKVAHWTTGAPGELRRRGFESVLTEEPAEPSASSSHSGKAAYMDSSAVNAAAAPPPFNAKLAASIPACFQSEATCMNVTNNCSGHGRCLDKYGTSGTCFSCHCFSTLNHPEDEKRPRSTTKWGGAICQKRDVSVPFWLLAGFSIALVGTITFAIGLLYSVGEEKLPGVIGAGVSRSK